MSKSKITIAAAMIFSGTAITTPSNAGSQVCGYYAFGGAFQSQRSAQRVANQLNAMALDLRTSDSPTIIRSSTSSRKATVIVASAESSQFLEKRRRH